MKTINIVSNFNNAKNDTSVFHYSFKATMRITDNCYLITLDMLSHPLHMSNTMTVKCSYLKNIIFLSFFTYNKAVYAAHLFFCI